MLTKNLTKETPRFRKKKPCNAELHIAHSAPPKPRKVRWCVCLWYLALFLPFLWLHALWHRNIWKKKGLPPRIDRYGLTPPRFSTSGSGFFSWIKAAKVSLIPEDKSRRFSTETSSGKNACIFGWSQTNYKLVFTENFSYLPSHGAFCACHGIEGQGHGRMVQLQWQCDRWSHQNGARLVDTYALCREFTEFLVRDQHSVYFFDI